MELTGVPPEENIHLLTSAEAKYLAAKVGWIYSDKELKIQDKVYKTMALEYDGKLHPVLAKITMPTVSKRIKRRPGDPADFPMIRHQFWLVQWRDDVNRLIAQLVDENERLEGRIEQLEADYKKLSERICDVENGGLR